MRPRTILAACGLWAASSLLPPAAAMAQQHALEEAPSRAEDVLVRVDNHNWLDMHVYVSRSGGPLRSLGMVTGLSSAVFHLPPDVSMAGTEVRVIADPIGGNGIYVSPTLLANPQSEILLAVENALELSYTSVSPRVRTE